jgi:hypothetical protein
VFPHRKWITFPAIPCSRRQQVHQLLLVLFLAPGRLSHLHFDHFFSQHNKHTRTVYLLQQKIHQFE